MKKTARLLLGGIAIGLLALLGWKAYPRFRPAPAAAAQHWVCPMRCLHKVYDHAGTCPVCHMKLIALDQAPKGKLLGYTCPMHYSQTVFEQPGRCPFCTLELKPIYEGGEREAKHFDIAAWPSVGGKMAVYFRPYEVRKVQVDRLLRVAGSVSKDGRHLSAKLALGEETPRKGATAMIMPAVGYSRPALGTVESVGRDGRLAIKIPNAISGFPQVTAEIRVPGALVLAVPVESIDESGPQAQVFVRTGAGDQEAYVPRAVKLGQRGESFVEVLSGLKGGESVAGSGVFWLEAQWRMDHPDSEPSL